jgi:hypothetical protein
VVALEDIALSLLVAEDIKAVSFFIVVLFYFFFPIDVVFLG